MGNWFWLFIYLMIGTGVAMGNEAQRGPPYRIDVFDIGIIAFWPCFVSARLTFLYLDTRYKENWHGKDAEIQAYRGLPFG